MTEETKLRSFILEDNTEVNHYKTFLCDAKIEVITRDKLAHNINSDYSTRHAQHPAVFIGILNGCYQFMSKLTCMLSINAQVDFIRIKSFKDGVRSELQVIKDVEVDLTNKVVYLIDEINDTGQTLQEAVKLVKQKNPLVVYTVSLLQREGNKYPSTYNGHIVPKDLFLYGYGLDDENGLNRNNLSIYYK